MIISRLVSLVVMGVLGLSGDVGGRAEPEARTGGMMALCKPKGLTPMTWQNHPQSDAEVMTFNYTKALKKKQTETKLSTEALANAIGVSPISLRGILKGKSRPNATTAQKYADYLGLSAETVAPENVKRATGKAVSAKQGKKANREKREASPKSARPANKSSSTAKGLGAQLVEAVSAAAGVLDDHLALAVHRAGKIERELISHILGLAAHDSGNSHRASTKQSP
jgi:transcriptional regulator with XRE-family HTH domain